MIGGIAQWNVTVTSAMCKKVADDLTAFEKRFGKTYDGPNFHFGSSVEHLPITAKDKSKTYPFVKKTLKWIFLGYVLRSGGRLVM